MPNAADIFKDDSVFYHSVESKWPGSVCFCQRKWIESALADTHNYSFSKFITDTYSIFE